MIGFLPFGVFLLGMVLIGQIWPAADDDQKGKHRNIIRMTVLCVITTIATFLLGEYQMVVFMVPICVILAVSARKV